MDNLSHRSFVDFIFEFIISLIAASWADALSLTIVLMVSRRIWLFSCGRGAVVVSGVGAWYKEGSEATLQFRSPRNSGLQGPPLLSASQYQNVQKVWTSRSTDKPPLYGHPTFYIFPNSPLLGGHFHLYIASMKYQTNAKINSCGKIISSF